MALHGARQAFTFGAVHEASTQTSVQNRGSLQAPPGPQSGAQLSFPALTMHCPAAQSAEVVQGASLGAPRRQCPSMHELPVAQPASLMQVGRHLIPTQEVPVGQLPSLAQEITTSGPGFTQVRVVSQT